MRIIPTKVHGYLDYIVGFAFLVPCLLSYRGTPVLILFSLGILTIVYSFMTNYEMGAMKVIPVAAHLVIDFISGAFLAASPWLFNFSDTISTPFLVAGIFEMVVSLFTRLKPSGKLNEVEAQKEREQKGAVLR